MGWGVGRRNLLRQFHAPTWNATHVVLKVQTSLTSKKSRVCSMTSRGRFICDQYTAAVAVKRCQDYSADAGPVPFPTVPYLSCDLLSHCRWSSSRSALLALTSPVHLCTTADIAVASRTRTT